MKVLLIKDVYKLGRAGDVKKVADGYGRNFLIPQGLAVLATPSALQQVKHIRQQADTKRAVLNQEMGGIAELLSKLTISYSAKAGETADTDKRNLIHLNPCSLLYLKFPLYAAPRTQP